MRIAIIRLRPSIGDALLLGPAIRELKKKHRAEVTVITISDYAAGGMTEAFSGIPWVDKVEAYPSDEAAYVIAPDLPRRFDAVYDATDAFLRYEVDNQHREHWGIAEFWTRHFGVPTDDLLPQFNVSPGLVDPWLSQNSEQIGGRPLLGVVLQSGHPARNWNYHNLWSDLVTWAHTSGFAPVTIDQTLKITNRYAIPFIGKRLKEVAALLQACEVVVTPDTGLLHLAEAVGTPTVSMFGPVDPCTRTGGYNTTVLPRVPAGRCKDPECPTCKFPYTWSCMRAIKLNEIVEAVRGIRGR